jgi:hypothetical protein
MYTNKKINTHTRYIITTHKQADVCMINAGNIRNNAAYPLDKQRFTYKDLKASRPVVIALILSVAFV